jgi:hypothetical protein
MEGGSMKAGVSLMLGIANLERLKSYAKREGLSTSEAADQIIERYFMEETRPASREPMIIDCRSCGAKYSEVLPGCLMGHDKAEVKIVELKDPEGILWNTEPVPF